MSKSALVILILLVILTVSFLTIIRNATPDVYKPGVWSEADQAVRQAQHIYNQARDNGADFSTGPCLSNALIPGWVLDIVHSPRQAVDDLPENQCKSYVDGQAKHFVEMDTGGNLIRVK